jgi:sulfur transfer complex TusBCD TusB component (DsrH family)
VQSLFDRYARKYSCALLCAAAIIVAGCHHRNPNSGYGIGWVTLTDTPGDFTSYIVTVNSVTLTGKTYGVVTAVATPETVDFTKLDNIAELWSSASIPNDTYISATIVVDYTNATISVMDFGRPIKSKVVDTTGAVATTQTINVTFDPKHQLVITPTLSSSSAERLAIDFDLAASNVVVLANGHPTVTVKPFLKIATSASDTKPVRVRGPLINSSAAIGTYTVEVRPFFDEINSLGLLTIFGDANTVYQINGVTSVGAPGITQLSQLSAGSTVAAAYTTYTPTPTLNPAVSAAQFKSTYVIAGSTLEDFYTQGLEGDVTARSGDTLTVRGSTLQLNDGSSHYDVSDAVVLLGPATLVTAENNTTLKGLNYKSIAVGQHIIARGLYQLPASGVITLDATGSTSTNTGSVRMQSTQLWGSLVSSASGSLTMDLQTINNWPVSIFYTFAGNGPSAVVPASYEVNKGTATLPAGALDGDPVWISGVTTAFGSAPPDFNAFTINTEVSVPARLQVDWTSAGTITPFTTLTDTGLTIDLGDPHFSAGVISIGAESIALKSLAETPQIVPQATPAATAGLPPVFLPMFSIGNLSAADTTTITEFNAFADFVAQLPKSIVAATPALHLVATGTYNRGSNTFTASTIDVVN